MSESLDRIPHERAMAAARLLMEALEIREAQIVGSLRRLVSAVGDIEIVVPMPEVGAFDALFERIKERFDMPGLKPHPVPRQELEDKMLFGDCPSGTMVKPAAPPSLLLPTLGKVIKGAKPGFRYCQVCLQLSGEPRAVVNVDIFRYDQGDQGNRGWIELIRTGPADFGKQACIRWKQISGGFSKDGYPHNRQGFRIPVPTEQAAFDLLGWDWVPPERRR